MMSFSKEARVAREKLDENVLVYIKQNVPLTRAMNLERAVEIPKELIDAARKRGAYKGRATSVIRMRLVDGSLQRLKKAGKIYCIKDGTPYWKAVK